MIEPGSTFGGSMFRGSISERLQQGDRNPIYICLGCYLLDRSFMLNSNSILIY
jgi:hypothetical protein